MFLCTQGVSDQRYDCVDTGKLRPVQRQPRFTKYDVRAGYAGEWLHTDLSINVDKETGIPRSKYVDRSLHQNRVLIREYQICDFHVPDPSFHSQNHAPSACIASSAIFIQPVAHLSRVLSLTRPRISPRD